MVHVVEKKTERRRPTSQKSTSNHCPPNVFFKKGDTVTATISIEIVGRLSINNVILSAYMDFHLSPSPSDTRIF